MKKGIIFLISIIVTITITIDLYASSNKKKASSQGNTNQTSTASVNVNEQTTSESDQVKNNLMAPLPKKKKVEQKGEIKGKVLDEEKKPVIGVTVKCLDETGRLIQQTKTDKNGEYNFKDLLKGKYKVLVEYQSAKELINLKIKKKGKRAPIPTGLSVHELAYDIYGKSFIRVEWDKMSDVNGYKCELLDRNTKSVISQLDGIKQNYCEFGNLKENTEYMVKVYSKNELGYSLSYALGFIKTKNKKPPSPYNIAYTYAKNNRIDLMWNGIKVDDLKGYILQVKKDKSPYLYYSNNGLVNNLKEAEIISASDDLVKLSIYGNDKKSAPIIENTIPYSFRAFEIDNSNRLSEPSDTLSNVILEDTVPPLPITKIEYNNIRGNLIRVKWITTDSDVVKYRLYYGINKDRWAGVVVTSKNYYDFIIDKKYISGGRIYVAVIAIDRAGNESGYKPVEQVVNINGKEVEQSFILSETNVYKDFSVTIKAIKPVAKVRTKKKIKKIVKKVPRKPKVYEFSYLESKGFVIGKGETANLTGEIRVPQNTLIQVKSGGRLNLNNVVIEPSRGLWGGVRFLGGSYGKVNNVTIKSAARGIVILDDANISMLKSLKVYNSKDEALFISNSSLSIINSVFKGNGLAVYIENSSVKMDNVIVEKNNRGILTKGYNIYVDNALITNNKIYGLRLSGKAKVTNSTFKTNQVGIFIEDDSGKTEIYNSIIDNNLIDGIVTENSNMDIVNNEISNNQRYGIYARKAANPYIVKNNISNNGSYAVFGGGKVINCYIAFNNGSPYIDETKIKGRIDNIFSSSSTDIIKQIYNVDYIEKLSLSPIIFSDKKDVN